VDAADPVVERLAAVELIRSGPAQRGQVASEVLSDDRVGEAEVAVPQVSPRLVERALAEFDIAVPLSWPDGLSGLVIDTGVSCFL
jgi:hypothetical protein